MTVQTFPFSDAGVTAAIVALGETPDAVAETLRGLGLKGTPGEPCACILAHYLLKAIPLAMRVTVQPGDEVRWSLVEVELWDVDHLDQAEARLTEAANAFALKFDLKDYPDLIGEASHAF